MQLPKWGFRRLPKFKHPDIYNNFAIHCASPFYDENEIEKLFDKRIYSKLRSKNTIHSVDDLILRLENLIKNVASKTITVNKNIFMEMIK